MIKKFDDQIQLLESKIQGFKDRIAELKSIKDKIESTTATATEAQRTLAVELHKLMCVKEHGLDQEHCSWENTNDYDDPALCDWTEKAHLNWLAVTQKGTAKMKELGYKVTEPK